MPAIDRSVSLIAGTDTRHVRIEMESDFMSTLKEITLMKRTEEVMAWCESTFSIEES